MDTVPKTLFAYFEKINTEFLQRHCLQFSDALFGTVQL